MLCILIVPFMNEINLAAYAHLLAVMLSRSGDGRLRYGGVAVDVIRGACFRSFVPLD